MKKLYKFRTMMIELLRSTNVCGRNFFTENLIFTTFALISLDLELTKSRVYAPVVVPPR